MKKIYLPVLLFIFIIIILLPLIKIPITSSSRGIIRSYTEDTRLTSMVSGRIIKNKLNQNNNKIMKKYIFYLILIISIGFFFYKNYFGHAKSNKILIDKFSTTIIDSLSPVSGKGYSIQLIKIKGSIDDSIMIKGFYGYPIYLKGTINKEFNNEYYGSSPSVIKIDPYKAKTGELQIIHIIK
ncbi:hypothetical protein OBK24_07620 [Empedobacter falsenii]